jgi:hypothetical protein
VPIRGKGVKRTEAFRETERMILSRGFRSGAPGRFPSPGFHFYSRSRYVLQICNGRTLAITRPDGTVEVVSTKNLTKLDTALDQLILEIEEQQS